VRFKDLLGRSNKPDPEPSGGRLLTTPGGLAPSVPPQTNAAPPAAAAEPPKPAGEAARPAAVAGRAADLPVADAFARLLAVEQGELVAATEPEPDTPTATAPAAAAPLSDEDVDRIALRVAERLGSTTFAADVQRIVADVSERLIREEIQRIRRAAESG
jgi:hypothetical protein